MLLCCKDAQFQFSTFKSPPTHPLTLGCITCCSVANMYSFNLPINFLTPHPLLVTHFALSMRKVFHMKLFQLEHYVSLHYKHDDVKINHSIAKHATITLRQTFLSCPNRWQKQEHNRVFPIFKLSWQIWQISLICHIL